MNNKKSFARSLLTGVSIAVGLLVFAYAFQVTDVDFSTTKEETRQKSITRVMRALAHPDLFYYETDELNIEVPFYLPCPEGETPELPEVDSSAPYMTANKSCGAPFEAVKIEGFNLEPYSQGPINFVTFNGVKKQMGSFSADENGSFAAEVELPNRQPVEEAQHIRVTVRTNIGAPKWSDNAIATWDKIIETIFIALLATTLGTLIAIPISFIAARNLMIVNRSPLTSIAFSIIGWIAGIWIGLKVARWLISQLEPINENLALGWVGFIVSIGFLFAILRWTMPTEDTGKPNPIVRFFSSAGIAITGIAGLIFFGTAFRTLGETLIEPLGFFGFLGNFIFQFGVIIVMITPGLIAVVTGAVAANILSKMGQRISDTMPALQVRLINVVLASLAGAVLFAIIGAGVEWFYQFENPIKTLYVPAGVGATIGLVLALITSAKDALPTGLIIYTITRTILNGTRSVEPLVMAIVAVIWVGIGPFAGSLALALHTVAALAKLYSEQVESILPGPIEAVQATGANQLQTIVYAVVPQIIPPYISFTMYRWDINVRMSTIIGFVGGGGIGFLLSQNINLLDYRAASAQMLAIAVVVSLMDYISSKIRERLV